jgi:hypothetical protein
MSQAVIEKPTTNSPFHEPTRHFRFTNEGLTNDIRRRVAMWRKGGRLERSPLQPRTQHPVPCVIYGPRAITPNPQ